MSDQYPIVVVGAARTPLGRFHFLTGIAGFSRSAHTITNTIEGIARNTLPVAMGVGERHFSGRPLAATCGTAHLAWPHASCARTHRSI